MANIIVAAEMFSMLTSFALMRRRGSYMRHLPRRFRQSELAAVKRSRKGVFANCPTGT